jgi:hypothetical protein
MFSSRWATPNKLRQLQYRSYVYEVVIYHYPYKLLPLRHFESRLTCADHGFIARLVSDDPIAYIARPEGDEIPDGFYEVAYLKNVFQARGSALGFRVPVSTGAGSGKIEWLCFERGVQQELDMWTIETLSKEKMEISLFDKVGTLSKGPVIRKGTVTGYREHREWYEALERAKHPRVKIAITYKNKRRDQLREWEVVRAARAESLGLRDVEKGGSDEDTEGQEGGCGVWGEQKDGPMTPESAPVVDWRSRMNRQATGEYV